MALVSLQNMINSGHDGYEDYFMIHFGEQPKEKSFRNKAFSL